MPVTRDSARQPVRRSGKALAPGEAPPSPSLSVAVHADLRSEILSGVFEPGARLSPRALADRLGVSLSVVREALSRLTDQGLVVAAPQLGFSVVSLDLEDLLDLTKVRVLIEGAALREAVEHADVEYEARVVAAHHRLARTPFFKSEATMSITDEWSGAHAMFHDALISASPSRRLRDMAAGLRDRAELYRRWSGPLAAEHRHRDVGGEHRALMEAVLDHDADQAVTLLAAHIELTTAMLVEYAEHAEHAVGAEAGRGAATGGQVTGDHAAA